MRQQHRITRTVGTTAAAAALAIGGITLAGGAAQADTQTTPAAAPAVVESVAPTSVLSALINGPLIEGPLLDLGGLLNDLRIGQFQNK